METAAEAQPQSPEAKDSALDLEALAGIVLEIMRRELLLESDRIGK